MPVVETEAMGKFLKYFFFCFLHSFLMNLFYFPNSGAGGHGGKGGDGGNGGNGCDGSGQGVPDGGNGGNGLENFRFGLLPPSFRLCIFPVFSTVAAVPTVAIQAWAVTVATERMAAAS